MSILLIAGINVHVHDVTSNKNSRMILSFFSFVLLITHCMQPRFAGEFTRLAPIKTRYLRISHCLNNPFLYSRMLRTRLFDLLCCFTFPATSLVNRHVNQSFDTDSSVSWFSHSLTQWVMTWKMNRSKEENGGMDSARQRVREYQEKDIRCRLFVAYMDTPSQKSLR